MENKVESKYSKTFKFMNHSNPGNSIKAGILYHEHSKRAISPFFITKNYKKIYVWYLIIIKRPD